MSNVNVKYIIVWDKKAFLYNYLLS